MSALFVTATGTGVGKTFVTCALVHQLRARGASVRAMKPVLSGFERATAADSDAGQLLAALGRPLDDAGLDLVAPLRFAAPLSPDMAARREGVTIDFDAVVAGCRALPMSETAVIEGVGGAFVPLTERHTTADLMRELRVPTVLVTGSYLGTLSHTLATFEAMSACDIAPRAIVLSGAQEGPVALEETRETLQRFVRGTPILLLPRAPSWRDAADLTSLLPP